jgi:hypothetical protein
MERAWVRLWVWVVIVISAMARRKSAEYFMQLGLVMWFAGRICEFVVRDNSGGVENREKATLQFLQRKKCGFANSLMCILARLEIFPSFVFCELHRILFVGLCRLEMV